MKIELEQRMAPQGAWNEGKPIRGDRTVVVDGLVWAIARMKCHGMHGNSFEFYDAEETGIQKLDHKGKPYRYTQLESAWGSTRRSRRDGDTATTEEKIIAKVRELITKGRLVHPDEIKAKAAQEEAESRAWLDKRKLDRTMIADALRGCWARPDLTNAERVGLEMAWAELTLDGSITGEISTEKVQS